LFSGYGFQTLVFKLWFSSSGFQALVFKLWFSSSGFQAPDFRLEFWLGFKAKRFLKADQQPSFLCRFKTQKPA
jgi:hypothetical protein